MHVPEGLTVLYAAAEGGGIDEEPGETDPVYRVES